MEQPPDLKKVWDYVAAEPNQMFMFKDEMAGMTFDPDLDCVMYVRANFDPKRGAIYNTYILNSAISAAMN